jgi:hypothetical protein
MKRLEFVFFDAGGGHRSAATALKAVAEQQGRPWDIKLFNLQEELDSLDIFRKITRLRMQDIYNRMLAKGWTLGSEYLLPPMHWIIRAFQPAQIRMLTEIWRRDRPDMVISVVPNFNRALFQASQKARSGTPFVTILTDFADYPAFLARKTGPLCHLRDGEGLRSGARFGKVAGEDVSRFGDDPAALVSQ